MRDFLCKLMATITRHPRYHPEEYELDGKLHWSKELWTSNIFRAYEWLFGRGFGIRKEAISSPTGYIPLSFEAKVVYEEVKLRQAIREWVNFLSFPFVFNMPNVNIGLAIAFDATSHGTTTTSSPLTWSHTCTGSNGLLTVFPGNTATSATISTPTYNSVSMTLTGSQRSFTGGLCALYWLVGPTTGVNTVSVAFGGSLPHCIGAASSYSGVKQTAQPDAVGGAGAQSGNNPTHNVITVADNCWVVGGLGFSDSNNATAGLTARQDNLVTNGNGKISLEDTNGVVHPAGTQAINWTLSTVFQWGIQGASFSPAGVAAIIGPGWKTLLGVGQI